MCVWVEGLCSDRDRFEAVGPKEWELRLLECGLEIDVSHRKKKGFIYPSTLGTEQTNDIQAANLRAYKTRL